MSIVGDPTSPEADDAGGIRRDSPVPLYRQLKELIARDIERGVLAPDDPVGPESELSRRHRVSRITVRQALGELEQEGLITRIVGKGTFVRDRPQPGRQPALAGFGEDIRAMGLTPSYRTLTVDVRAAPELASATLDVPEGAPVTYIERVLLADNRPVAYAESYLPFSVTQRLPVRLDVRVLDERSLYGLLEEAGMVLDRAVEDVEPRRPTPAEAALLELASDELTLDVRRQVFDGEGRTCEFARMLYAGSRYSYRAELRRTGARQ